MSVPKNPGDVKVNQHEHKPMTKEEAIQSPVSEAKDFQITGGTRKQQADEVLREAKEILAQHDNKESNIGVTDKYWGLMNTYRDLTNDE